VYELDARGRVGASAQAQEAPLPVDQKASVSESILEFSIVKVREE
jgi:hypothetical protein